MDIMLDGIFGSDENEELKRLKEELDERDQKIEDLQERINKLEEKLRRSKEKLEREKNRAKEAVTEKQKTDKKLKEARHKIESLEDRIENLEKQTREVREEKESKFLTREETLTLLDELESLQSEKASLVTHYLEEPDEVGDDEVLRVLRNIDSPTGYMYVKNQFKTLNCVLVPPFLVEHEFFREKGLRLEKIRNILESKPEVYFVSIHAGESVAGLLEGNNFSSFDLIKGDVKSKHSKGGFSQGRFERRRDEQIQKHLEEVAEHVETTLGEVDYLVLDGNKRLKSELIERLSVSAPLIERNLDIGKVSKEEKEKYAEKIWGSWLYIL